MRSGSTAARCGSPRIQQPMVTQALAALLLGSALIMVSPLTWANQTDSRKSTPSPITEAFDDHDPASRLRLNHQLWSEFLARTVAFAGHSTQRLSRGARMTWVGSKMRYGNHLPSRYEGNRVVLSGFNEQHFAELKRYRRALEAAADQLPLSRLNRDEQLAYWLNLYNAHALEHVAEHYPGTTTEPLRSPPGAPDDGIWHARTLNVAGVALSLVDIEREIVFALWDDPRVLYGLWQGAIGGPRLPLKAYTGAKVWRMLEENAIEFVNSNRGMNPRGKTLDVSLIYGWGATLFDDEQHLLRHISAYARPPFSHGLDAVTQVDVDLYDWHLADLSGGTHHQGQWNNTAALVAGVESSESQANLFISDMMRKDISRERMPPQTIALLRNMERFNQRDRRTHVTIRDCETDEDCADSMASDEDR